MYCPYCGCELPDDAVFCKQCGHKIPLKDNSGNPKPSSENNSPVGDGTDFDIKQEQEGLSGLDNLQRQQKSLETSGDNNNPNITNLQTSVTSQEKPPYKEQREHIPAEGKKKKSHTKVVVVIIVIALICIGAITAALVIPSLTTNDTTPSVTPTTTTTKLVVNSTPSGASVYLNGTYKGKTPFISNVSPSTRYTVKISMDGYADYYSTVTLNPGETKSIGATLTQTKTTTTVTTAELEINSTPSGASVYLNGTYKGVTPFSTNVTPSAQYTVRVSKSGYQDYTNTVSVASGYIRTLNVTLDKEQVATAELVVNSTPSGASVYLNGTYKGVTPFSTNVTPSAQYTVRVSKSGYQDYTNTVSVASGYIRTLNVTLDKEQVATAELVVNSIPSGASVYLNGTYKGVTPFSTNVTPSAQYTVRISKSGYIECSETVSVDAGYTRTLTATLVKAQSSTPTTTVDTTTDAGKAKAIAAAMEPSNSTVRSLALNAISNSHSGDINIDQVCDIYDYLRENWTYVNDPNTKFDYFASASESASLMKGDCDDFAILMASCMQAIGGTPRIILAWDKSGDGHAYAEVHLTDNKSDLDGLIDDIRKRYDIKDINYTIVTDKNGNESYWLNLDWGDKYPGGRYFANSGTILVVSPDGTYYRSEFNPNSTY